MLTPDLPFSRKFLNDFIFDFNQNKKISNDSVIILLSGIKFKIIPYNKNLRENYNLISFGKFKKQNCFVAKVDKSEIDESFKNIISNNIDETERILAGIAKSFLTWNNENRFCGKCGEKTVFSIKEPAKVCKNCSHIIYPRLNPAIIVVVKNKNKLLLTKKSEWQNNRYGLIAGFIEHGETAEEGVKREVFEESGLNIEKIRYITSQFWPFPYQLMLGFEAEFVSGEIKIQKSELEEVKWFDKKNLPGLPPKSSIARHLIDIQL